MFIINKIALNHLKLLHDNAWPHIHKNIKSYIKTQGITLIEHPSYLPDLAPSDFWLFDEIKRRLPEQVISKKPVIKNLCNIER